MESLDGTYYPFQSVPRTVGDVLGQSGNIPIPVLQATDQIFSADESSLEFYLDSSNNKVYNKVTASNRIDNRYEEDLKRSELLSQQLSALHQHQQQLQQNQLQQQQYHQLRHSGISENKNDDLESNDKSNSPSQDLSIIEDHQSICSDDNHGFGWCSIQFNFKHFKFILIKVMHRCFDNIVINNTSEPFRPFLKVSFICIPANVINPIIFSGIYGNHICKLDNNIHYVLIT